MQSILRSLNMRTAIISIVVIASLCFSIGEGLRLTPFPVTVATETEGFNERDNSLRRYGPLQVPARAQSRNKRQVIDFAFPTLEGTVEPPRMLGLASLATLEFHPICTGSPPIGRAPPAC